jgi:4-hydroxybenzoate polyprenyltransferase
MNQASTKTVLIVLAVYLLVYVIAYSIGGKDYIGGVAIVTSIMALFAAFAGLVLMISEKNRKIGANIFVSALLILVIGFGVCTSAV